MKESLPHNWIDTRLEELTLPIEKWTSIYVNPNDEFSYLDINSIDNTINRITDPKKYKYSEAPSRAQQIVKAGDTLFSTVRTYLKNIAQVDSQYDNQIASTGFCVIRPASPLNKKYFFYLCLSKAFLEKLNELQRGSSYPAVRNSDVLNQLVPLPPLNEQNRIVEKLDELLSELEKGKEQLQTSLEQLKVYRQSILKHAFEGKVEFDGKFKNEDWINTSLSGVCSEITDGSHFSPKAVSEGYPYITVKDIQNDIIDFENSLKISKIDFDKLVYNGCKPNKGDVLFSKDGTVGKVSLIDYEKDFVVLSSIAILRTNTSIIDSRLLFYALKSTQFINQALDQKKGVAIRRIILRDLKNLTLRFPKDKSLQNSLIEYLQTTFESINTLEKELEGKIVQSDVLKQSLLQKAFEGKLVEQDPTDEPASVLLERIKKEREEYLKAEKEKKKKQKKTPKEKMKTRKKNISLSDIIKSSFARKEFTFDELRGNSNLKYDDLKDELFMMLDEGKEISMTFKKGEGVMKFKYIGK
ncbi:MAG TPA: restriction endonuclease subunit S [Chitinophagaceae bacterium]|nr:restriction endonuclease subunit S [Chitinophagaceae bacterium]